LSWAGATAAGAALPFSRSLNGAMVAGEPAMKGEGGGEMGEVERTLGDGN
jgi:hypothetical protein